MPRSQHAYKQISKAKFIKVYLILIFTVEVRPNAEGGLQKVKVKVRVNPNGVFSVVSASLVEKHVSKFLVIYEVICHGIGTKKTLRK